jgi:hypothetical protein
MRNVNLPPAALGPAKDHEELYTLMLANNAKHGKRFHYFDFHVFKGKLWCMFEVRPEELKRVGDGERSR